MSDTLVLSGGGSTIVATDELFIEAANLGQCAERAEGWASTIGHLWATDAGSGGLGPELESTQQLEEAQRKALRLAEDSRAARESLVAAMQTYSDTEQRISAMLSGAVSLGAWGAGVLSPLLPALAVLGTVAIGSLAFLVSSVLRVPITKLPALLAAQIKLKPGVLNRPEVVRLVRSLASSSDEFVAGRAGVPSQIAVPIGKLLGASQGAAALTALAALASPLGNKALVETPQKVTSAGGTRIVEPPRSIADVAARVPSSGGGDPQVRVERYGNEQDPRWMVYIAGTGDFAAAPSSDPFDLTSNIHATAGGDAASERAVREALAAAGARPGDPILSAGHSQGGLIAARLAEDPSMNVVGYVNLGGPLGAVNAQGVPGLSIEHSEDLVPGLGGTADSSADVVTVSRAALGENPDDREPMAAHALKVYRETALLMSASEEPRLQAWDDRVRNFVGSSEGSESRWRAERVTQPDR